jgi:spore germination protein
MDGGWLSRMQEAGEGARRAGRRLARAAAARLAGAWRAARAALARRGLSPRQANAVLAGGAVLAVGLLTLFAASRPGTRSPAPRLQPRPEIIGYFENGWSRIFTDSFNALRSHPRVIDTVLAFWYSVDGAGDLRFPAGPPRPEVIQYVKSHHMRMGVLVNNLGADMLWTKAVRNIVAATQQHGYQEVHIDFELLPPDARDALTAFIAQLRAALPRSVALSISVFPKLDVTPDVNGAYDYQALARYVDYEVIMLYDRHSPGGPPGPVSPWPWVVDNVNYFRGILPPNQIVVAAGVYGYDWPEGSTQAAEWPLEYIQKLAADHGARIQTDPASQNPYFRYTASDGTPHVVWFQDADTVRQRIDLVTHQGLRGIAIWRLGEENQKVWQVLEEVAR